MIGPTESMPAPTPPHIERRWPQVADILLSAWLIARKDLSIEFRTRSAFLSAVVFALLGLVIFYYAWDPTAVTATDLAPGVLWIIFTFSGLLGLHRSFGVETADHAIDGLLASPVSREAIFLGKAIANLIFVVAVQSIALPALDVPKNTAMQPGTLGWLQTQCANGVAGRQGRRGLEVARQATEIFQSMHCDNSTIQDSSSRPSPQ